MSDHLERVLEAMVERDIGLLLLGREDNARYVSGARRLWLAGTRPFAPGCAIVRETGAVHLLSITDEGVPPEVGAERLYPISWNPMNLVGAVATAPGTSGARRIGLDSITPLFGGLLRMTFPEAEFVDGSELMRAVRRVKAPADVDRIRAALAVAEDALAAAVAALRPGVRERELVGLFVERMASHGVTTPTYDPVIAVASNGGRRHFATDRELADGDLVALDVGVLAGGWEGCLARTWPCGPARPEHRRAWSRWWAAWATTVGGVRPGRRVGDVRARNSVDVHGVGTGYEPLADHEILAPGMVVSVELLHAGVLGKDTLLVTDAGHDVLTRAPFAARS
jgi:Xaa-Pro dipeptidase